MALTKGKASFRAICIYLVVCWIGTLIIMSIEYKSLKEHSVSSNQKLNHTSQLQQFLWKKFSINMNASSAKMVLEEITNYVKVDSRHAYSSWKKEFNFTTFRKWQHFITSTMTTVGYGDVYPETIEGKVFAILFSLIGIPVCTYMIATLGGLFCMAFSSFKFWLKRGLLKQDVEAKVTVYCVVQCTAITITFVVLSGFLVAADEGWNYFDGIYFSFITVTTIGYGDITPTVTRKWYSELLGGVAIIGLVLTAMTINAVVKLAEQRQYTTTRLADDKMKCKSKGETTTTGV